MTPDDFLKTAIDTLTHPFVLLNCNANKVYELRRFFNASYTMLASQYTEWSHPKNRRRALKYWEMREPRFSSTIQQHIFDTRGQAGIDKRFARIKRLERKFFIKALLHISDEAWWKYQNRYNDYLEMVLDCVEKQPTD